MGMTTRDHHRLLQDLRNKLPNEVIIDIELRHGRWYAIILFDPRGTTRAAMSVLDLLNDRC